MIKKILCAFLMIMVSGIANANIHIDGKTVSKIALEHIDSEHQVPALQEYNVQLKATGNYTMSASGLYKVCTAAGWDIATPDGKTKCDNFVKALVAESDYKYYEICGKDKGKSGGTEYCVDNVFYSLIGGIQVTMLQADGLCKEYARVKYNDDIECSTNTRKGTINKLNDYVKCTSKLKPIYYEFKFDDVVESSDKTVLKGVLKSVGKLYNVDISDPGCTVERMINDTACSIGYKTTDANVCNQINNSLKTFGYTSKVENVSRAGLNSEKLCGVHNILGPSKLRTAFGIDNMVFYNSDIRRQASQELESEIKMYVTNVIKPETLTSFYCNKGWMISNDANILTCYVNENPVDFVFKDLSAIYNLGYENDGKEKMQCIIRGGKYANSQCFDLGEEQCNKINEIMKNETALGNNKGARFKDNRCFLQGASFRTLLDEYQDKLGMLLAVTDCTVDVSRTGCYLVVVQGIAIGTKQVAKHIGAYSRFDEFYSLATSCKESACAKDAIKSAGKVLSVAGVLEDSDVRKIDEELARLVDLLDAEDLKNVSNWNDIINQLDGDPEDKTGTTLSVLYKLATGIEYAGTAISALSLTKHALLKLANVTKPVEFTTGLDKGLQVYKNTITTHDVIRGVIKN